MVRDDTALNGSHVAAIAKNEDRGSTYNLLLAEETRYGDVSIRVKVKPLQSSVP